MRYEVLSPDGFSIEMGTTYNSDEEVNTALNNFVKRYEAQGYYSTVINGSRYEISLHELKGYCKINKID